MAITKMTMSGFTPSTFTKYDDFLAGNTAYDPAATWLIQRTSPTSGSTVTFSSIPSTYKHLQLRINYITGSAGGYMALQFNSDTATNYNQHGLFGTGSSVVASGNVSTTSVVILGSNNGTIATYPNVAIVDILDYANTSKNKTIKSFGGSDKNAATTDVELKSGAWRSTTAINRIDITVGTAFTSGSTIALYGIVG